MEEFEPQPVLSMDELLETVPEPASLEDAQLRAVLEAMVYVTEEPLTVAQMAAVSGISMAPHSCEGPIGGLAARLVDSAMPNCVVQAICGQIQPGAADRASGCASTPSARGTTSCSPWP